jgi:rsbT co-antagonist protein RsbR
MSGGGDLTSGVSAQELARRKQWLEFTDDDEARLAEVNALAAQYADEVIEELYEHFLSFEETKRFFTDPATLTYVKEKQRAYFLRLTSGSYDSEYVSDRLEIGSTHERIGLDVKWYLGAYNRYLRSVGSRILQSQGDGGRAQQVMFSLLKLVFLDIGLALDTYIDARERTIREQQQALLELSTPVLPVRDGLLIVPIIGLLDARRAQQLMEQLLPAIRANRARVIVVDITGVPSVDSHVANHLVQTVEAARLMGATAIVTGVSAEVAQTLVTLGLDLGKLSTVGDLQGGLELAGHILDRHGGTDQSDG